MVSTTHPEMAPGQFDDAEDTEIPQKMEDLQLQEDADSDDFFDDADADDDDDDDYWDDDDGHEDFFTSGGSRPNRQSVSNQPKTSNVTKFQPAEKVFKRFSSKINVEKYEGPKLQGSAINPVIEQNRKMERER